jgi:hypothetical protein
MSLMTEINGISKSLKSTQEKDTRMNMYGMLVDLSGFDTNGDDYSRRPMKQSLRSEVASFIQLPIANSFTVTT